MPRIQSTPAALSPALVPPLATSALAAIVTRGHDLRPMTRDAFKVGAQAPLIMAATTLGLFTASGLLGVRTGGLAYLGNAAKAGVVIGATTAVAGLVGTAVGMQMPSRTKAIAVGTGTGAITGLAVGCAAAAVLRPKLALSLGATLGAASGFVGAMDAFSELPRK